MYNDLHKLCDEEIEKLSDDEFKSLFSSEEEYIELKKDAQWVKSKLERSIA